MIATWVPPRNRKGYFGFCWTEEHRDAVYARLTQLTLQAFATEGHTLFQPGYKRARVDSTGDTSGGNRAGGPTPKAKRRKRASGAGASSAPDAGAEPNTTEGAEASDGGESGKSL